MSDWLQLSDEDFLRDCRWEAFRGSGPGGQKRNKTSSAIRLTHEPTGLSATASDSRSQSQNKSAALKRLRLKIALEIRRPVIVPMPQQLDLSPRSPDYLPTLARVLDLLNETELNPKLAAERIGIRTARLISYLKSDEKLWQTVNQLRRQRAMPNLT
jgi:hypothetical protein